MNLTNILNTIRDNASETYRERIPEATQNNIETIQEAMLSQENVLVANEFMNTLMNMLVKVVVHNKVFSNPLKGLKKGKKPLGDTVQEIYNNFLKGESYDPTGANLLQRKLPDTKVVYHRMNRKDKYKVTVNRMDLMKAFKSYENLEAYINSIITSLYNSAELDEFTLTKELIRQAIDNKAIKEVYVDDPTLGEAEGKKFIKTVKIVSGDMVFPNSNNNAYLEAQNDDTKPIITFSRKSEQVLIIDNATDVSVNVDVLASLFNMSVAEFNDTKKIVIDAFPVKDVRACLVDEQFFQIFDDLYYVSSFKNEEGLYDNYYLHVWQTLAYSILVNAVCFRVAKDTADENTTIDEFTITKTLKSGVTLGNKATKVTEGSSYKTLVKGVSESDSVTVTMGGSTINGVYDAATNVIEIDEVTGNIVITVA